MAMWLKFGTWRTSVGVGIGVDEGVTVGGGVGVWVVVEVSGGVEIGITFSVAVGCGVGIIGKAQQTAVNKIAPANTISLKMRIYSPSS